MDRFKFPEEIQQLRRQIDRLRKRARELEEERELKMQEYFKRIVRESRDQLLNRTQCLEYLPITTLKTLKEWERKYSPYGYLRFQDNKILRSELLRFIDAKQSGRLYRDMRRRK